jgi:DNA-binding SARP family transcriptional activator
LFATDSTGPALVVRVLGVPSIPDRPDIGRRELILAVLLACRGGTLAASAAQDALWGGKPVEPKTVWNFVAAVRRALGDLDDGTPVMPAADRAHGTLRLHPRVTTDLDLLRKAVAAADEMSSTEAMSALREALSMVEGPPFDAVGYDWAHRDQDVAEAARVIEQAVDRLVALALEAGQHDLARHAINRGLRGLPGDEHLYRLRMRLEAHTGNTRGLVAAYEELCVYLADLEVEPSPATTALYNELRSQRTSSTVS